MMRGEALHGGPCVYRERLRNLPIGDQQIGVGVKGGDHEYS